VKLVVGVMLAIAGLVATFGAVFGFIVYIRECVGTHYAVAHLSTMCAGSSFALELSVWALAAAALDAAAIFTIRHRADLLGEEAGPAEVTSRSA
jgi:hypothetical protein